MNYWATSDPLFEDGHYVEDWEIRRFEQLSTLVQAFVRSQAAVGNKVRSITGHTVFLCSPPACGVLGLPEGLHFYTPIQHCGVRVLDGDSEGVICCVATGERIYPSGYESPLELPPNVYA